MNRNHTGFTLIELLVVIAIIGTLSSIILSALNNARTKGIDASAKSSLNNSRAQAQLFYDANNNRFYGGTAATDVCDPSAAIGTVKGVYTFLNSAAKAEGAGTYVHNGPGGAGIAVCNSDPNHWAIQIPLSVPLAGSPTYYCTDSNGFATTTTNGLTLANSLDFDCSN